MRPLPGRNCVSVHLYHSSIKHFFMHFADVNFISFYYIYIYIYIWNRYSYKTYMVFHIFIHILFLSMVIQLHKDQRGQVRLNSDLSWSFPIVNDMKQGCVLASMLLLYTSATILTAVCLTLGDCKPTQKHLSSCSVTSSSLMTLLLSPTPKEPCRT